MNNTKWEEIRCAMYGLGDLSPKWRTLDMENGYLSTWDGEWFYHFSIGGYTTIQWLELKVDTDEQREVVKDALAQIHVPGEATEHGFKIYGYVTDGQTVDYLKAS